MAWYCKGFVGAPELRAQLSQIDSLEKGTGLLDQAMQLFSELPDRTLVAEVSAA
jgi:hypothetical protein